MFSNMVRRWEQKAIEIEFKLEREIANSAESQTSPVSEQQTVGGLTDPNR